MGIQDDLLADEEAMRQDARLRLAVDNQKPTDQSARIVEMQMQTGLPLGLIERNLDQVEREAKRRNFDPERFRQESPIFAKWASENPHHPAIIDDDYERLTGIEWAYKAFLGAHEAGWATVEQSQIGNRILLGQATPEDRERLEQLKTEFPAEQEFGADAWYEKLVTEAGRLLPTMEHVVASGFQRGLGGASAGAGAAALAGQAGPQAAIPEEVVTVPAAAGIGFVAGQTSGSFEAAQRLERGLMAIELMEVRDEDGNALPDHVVRAAAEMVGVVNASLELLGLGAIGKHLGGEKFVRRLSRDAVKAALKRPTVVEAIGRFGLRYGQSVGGEVATEVLQESSNILAAEIAKGLSPGEFQGTTADEIADRLSEIAVRTMQGTAVIGGIGPSGRFVNDVRRVREAGQRQAIFRALGENSKASTLRSRSPAKFREFVQKVRESGLVEKIRIPVDRFSEYFQSVDLDPEQVAREVTGSETAYSEASASGADIEIPVEDYASKLAPTPHHDALVQDLRLHPDEMTFRESRIWTDNAQKIIDNFSESIDQEVLRGASYNTVYDDVFGQLVGVMDRDAAERNALLMASVFSTLGERTGQDPMALYQRYGLKVNYETPDILRTQTRVDTNIDPLIDRLRRGEIPTDAEAFGDSILDFLREKGGLQDQGGELSARDLSKEVRGLVKESGMTLDQAAEIASEAGYIAERDENLLLDAIDRSLSGEHVAPAGAGDPSLQSLRGALDDLRVLLEQEQIDVDDLDNASIRRRLSGEEFVNRIDPTLTPEQKADALLDLGKDNDPVVSESLSRIDREYGFQSSTNFKKKETIIAKSVRPSFVAKTPNAGVEHIRDSYRFKSVIPASGVEGVLPAIESFLEDTGAKIVKADFSKIESPEDFGWRMIAFDLQMPNGQLVEWYLPLSEMDAAKKSKGHLLFEKWRDIDASEMSSAEFESYMSDLRESRALYNEAFQAAAESAGLSANELVASFNSLEDSFSSSTSIQSSLSSATVIGRDGLLHPSDRSSDSPSGLSSKTSSPSRDFSSRSTAPIIPPDSLEFEQSKEFENNDIVESTGESDVGSFVTGQPVRFRYLRNTESATGLFGIPDKNSGFDRGYEPSGRYVVQAGRSDSADGFETGDMVFRNPLVLDAGEYGTETSWKRRLSKLYNGKTGKALSEALIADGIDGVVTIDGDHTSEILDLTSFDSTVALYQSPAPGSRLSAVHNLTSENLKFADEMGGLAVPSIAIVPEGQVMRNYGDVTLIGRRALGDPSEVPVFDADAYSQTFPRPEYPKVKAVVAQRVVDDFRPFESKWGERHFLDLLWDNAVNTPDPADTISRASNFVAVIDWFLSETQDSGVRLVKRDKNKGTRFPWADTEAIRRFSESGGDLDPEYNDIEGRRAFSEAAKEAITEYVDSQTTDEETARSLEKIYIENHFDENGLFGWARQSRVKEAHDNVGKRVPDPYEGLRRAQKKIKGHEAEFHSWITEKVMSMYDEPFLRIGRKKHSYTLSNIVEYMTRNRTLVGVEEGMTFGPGKARAVAATRFDDLEWMRNAAESQIAPEGEINEARERAESLLTTYRESVSEYYGTKADGESEFGRVWEGMDASMRALAKWAKTRLKRGSKTAMKTALRSEGFRGVPEHLVDDAIAAGEAMIDSPVPYFEAKPQRSVPLDEFAGAAIPEDASPETIKILERHGIKYQAYPVGKNVDRELSRAKAVNQLRKSLSESGEDVLFQARSRASITIDESTRQVSINLGKASDLSSFLHESGHFYLEVLGDLAIESSAPEQIVQDYAAVLNWLGVESRQAITRDHHEQFARGFEAYLREGKAPNPELQNAFSRFRAWLVNIYKRLSSLNVELTNDIRQVFDRLVATDEAIASASDEQNYVALFTTPESASMTPEQFSLYRKRVEQARVEAEESLTQKLLSVTQREQKAWWKAEREKVRDKVADDVHRLRVYRALSFLQRGTNPEGTPVDLTHIKLSRDDLVARYGKDFLKRLPRPYVYQAKGGMDADEAAALFGYRSGDELIQDIVNARHMNRLIEAETDARMKEAHPDPMMDGSLIDEAMSAVHSEHRAELLSAELRALRRLSAKDRPAVRAADRAEQRERREAREANRGILPDLEERRIIKRAATNIIGQKRVRDINPSTYRSAEAKASRLAFEAAGRGDYQTAYAEKRKQLLNHELYRAATAAREESEKIRAYFRKFDKRRVRERLGKAQDGLMEKIEALLEGLDLRKISLREIDRNAAKREILDQIERGAIVTSPSVAAQLETGTNWREIPMDDLRGLRDVVKQLEHQARTQAEAVVLDEKIAIRAAAERVSDSIREGNPSVDVNLGSPRPSDAAGRGVKEALLAWLRPAEVARQLDGGKDFGATFRTIIEPIRRAYAEKLIPAEKKIREDVADIYREHFTNKELGQLSQVIRIEELGASISRGDLLSLALNWGNDGNRQALLNSRFAGQFLYSEASISQALGRLSERDWAFVQDIWDHMDSYWGDLSALEKRRRGITPKKVEATPFVIQTSDGKRVNVRGGYYPLKYRSDLNPNQSGDDIEAEFDKFTQGRFVSATTRAGATHERVGSGGRPVRLGLRVIDEHLHEVVRDISLGDEVRFVMRILNDKEVRGAMVDTGNLEAHQVLKLWLQDAAIGEIAARGFINKASAYLRVGFTKAKLGWSATVTMLQLAGVPQTIAVVGSQAFAHGAGRWATNPAAAHRHVMHESAFMRARYQTNSWNKDVADTKAYLDSYFGGVPTRTKQFLDAASYTYFWPIAKTQMVVDEMTWLSAYWKGVNKKNLTGKDATLYADSVVENAQTSGFFSDRSGIERGTTDAIQQRQSQFVKLWTTLISYMLAKGNIAYAKGRQFMREPTPWGAVTLATDIVLLFAVEAILAGLIRGNFPDDDDEESLPAWLLKESAASATAGIPFIREIEAARYGGGNTPLGSLAGDIYRSYQQAEQGDVDAAMIKAFNNVGGTLFHYPSSQTNRAIDAYWRDMEGEDVPLYEYITGDRNRE